MDVCLTDAELGALSRNEVPPEEEARLRQHLNGCANCYAQLLRGERHDTGEHETGVVQATPNWQGPRARVELDWQPGADLGRYMIIETLGKGGMGVVYRAYDKELDRAVALKVLHGGDAEDSSSAGQSRLLREAQAMARLSHPNVVAVHDVLVLQQRVCVVMELVEGSTVRGWLKAEPRRKWKEIVDAFRAAGEGLAAAHDAKLIHRDFKPDNVLVGNDGRIRVTDFGIAREATEAGQPSDGARSAAPPPVSGMDPVHTPSTPGFPSLGGGLSSPLTREGQVVGTPRYMAPEQFDHRPADFRTDEFSFAVALYEALYGQYPFKGDSLKERLEAAREGKVQPPPEASDAPLFLFKILVRALSPTPEQRYPSMRELNLALAHDPRKRRNRLLLGAGVAAAVVVSLAGAAWSLRSRAQLCTGAETRLTGIWDEAQRAQIQKSFAATGLPFAQDSFDLAARVLDNYAHDWVTTSEASCLSTRVKGDQSDHVFSLRSACLQQRLDALAAVTDLFTRADGSTVSKAKATLDGLPRLSGCSDVARLMSLLPPPEDPPVAAEVERIRKEITRTRMLVEAGRFAEAEAVIRPAVEAAEKTSYAPVKAEAQMWLGAILGSNNGGQGLPMLTSAFEQALADGHYEVMAFASVRLAAINVRLRNNPRAMEWTDVTAAVNQRAKDPDAAVMVFNARGNIARNEGSFTLADKWYGKGMEEAKARLGPEHMTTLGLTYNHASALQNVGRFKEARGDYSVVIEAVRRTMGPKHPFLAYPLVGEGLVALNLGDPTAAKGRFEEVLEISGGKGPNASNAWDGLGEVALIQRRYEDALQAFEKARQLQEELNPGSVDAAAEVSRKGWVHLETGDADQAWKDFETVFAMTKGKDGAFDGVSDAQRGEATILVRKKELAKAMTMAEASVATLIPTRGKSHPLTLTSRLLVAEVNWALGHPDLARQQAQAVLDEALPELGETHPVSKRARSLLERKPTVATANK